MIYSGLWSLTSLLVLISLPGDNNIKAVIEIIKAATLCDEWADDVLGKIAEAVKLNQTTIPQYIWSFFDITGGYVFMKGSDPPWIQKQMTKARMEAILEKISTAVQSNSSKKPGPFPRLVSPEIGTRMVNAELDPAQENNFNEVYDSITENTTWSVLQLFVHRTIRRVGKGEEDDNKYCFWPLSQPMVNHRPVDLSLIGGPEGYIANLSKNKPPEWESQQGFAVPYSVSRSKVDEKKRIEMTFMINSGESKTDAEDYVQHLGADGANGPAGNLHCVALCTESLDKCLKALMQVPPPNTNQPHVHSPLVKLDLVFQLLSNFYGGLKTWEDWVDLYMVLFTRYFQTKKDIFASLKDEPEIHPHCFNDLVHKTTLYFQALHNVRLPFSEAQKRVASTVCSLTGWNPSNEVKYHLHCPETHPNVLNTDALNPDEQFSHDHDLTDTDQFKIINTGQSAGIKMVVFRNDGSANLTPKMIDCARELSERWSKANNLNQTREWAQVVMELCNDQTLKQRVLPNCIDLSTKEDKIRNGPNEFRAWASGVREYVLGCMYQKECNVKIFQNDFQKALHNYDRRYDGGIYVCTPSEFADFCMNLQAEEGKTGKKKKPKQAGERELRKELTQDGGIYLRRPPAPIFINLVACLFSYLASGSRNSLEAIQKLASLNGKRVANPRFIEQLEFLEIEDGFKEMVRG